MTQKNKRPMAFVRKISLFQREIIERISPTAMDLLLSRAGRISEGQVSKGRYYGSTMLTIDLATIGDRISERNDIATASRLAKKMKEERKIKRTIQTLALEEAHKISSSPLELVDLEIRIHSEGERVYIDIDLEGKERSEEQIEKAQTDRSDIGAPYSVKNGR